jgi:hypothetical protein
MLLTKGDIRAAAKPLHQAERAQHGGTVRTVATRHGDTIQAKAKSQE